MHRPSAEKEWQQPAAMVEPSRPARPARSSPLEVQAASYLAASARMVSLSIRPMGSPSLEIEHMYYNGPNICFCQGERTCQNLSNGGR